MLNPSLNNSKQSIAQQVLCNINDGSISNTYDIYDPNSISQTQTLELTKEHPWEGNDQNWVGKKGIVPEERIVIKD